MTDIDIQSLLARAEAAGIDVDTLPDDITEVALEKLIKKGMRKSKAKAKEGELLPAVQEWNTTDAGSLDRFVNALLDNGCSIESALAKTGCPRDVASELMADPRYSTRLNEIMGLRIKLDIASRAGDYAETAYGGKVLTEIFKAASPDEAASQQARQLKAGGRAARTRALEEIIKEAARQHEIINGGHTPMPEDILEIVRSVTQQQKIASAS